METAREALARLGLDLDEVVEMDQQLIHRQRGDRRICLCGHSVGRHTEFNGLVNCTVGKMTCPCREVQPVLLAEDTRPFLRKTEGAGKLHALSRGISALAAKGKTVEWIEDALVCHKCEATGVNLSPVPMTRSGRVADEATGYDALLCETCRREL